MSQHTKGPELSIAISVPSKKNFAWDFGLMIQPFLTHDENVLNQNDLRAGPSNQTIGLGAHIGGEYRMTRYTRVFFTFSANLIKSQFTGTSTVTDPVTGSNVSNVTVNNAFYIFDLGLKLGR